MSLGTGGPLLCILLLSFILENWEDGTKRGVTDIHVHVFAQIRLYFNRLNV